MTTEQLIDLVSEHFQEANDNKDERLKRINSVSDFVGFNLRLTELSEKEQQDFVACEEGRPLTAEQRELLDSSSEEKKEYYIDMWARSLYFRRCMWLNYLCGHSKEKPRIS